MLQLISMFLMFFNAFLFTQTNHPLTMGIILLFQTLLSCILTGLISKSFWFSYVLFLIFIGGMLILFIYMASLASNEKIQFSLFSFIMFFMFSSMTLMFSWLIDKHYISEFFNNEEININMNFLIKENYLSLSKMYNLPNNFIIILLISYLLLTLIMVVKMTNSFSGPLRPKNIYEQTITSSTPFI